MKYVIEVQGVSKRFRSTIALQDVSVNVPPGVVFALLGENGAGKTTLIRTLLGLERQDAGSLSVLGCDPVKDGVKIRRRVGYVSDSPSLYRWMTVGQAAHFTASFYPDGFLDCFDRLAQTFDLEQGQKIKHLSKGGQAKVALALSMAHQPDLLILDEPTSGLDAIVRRHFLESMIDVAAEGRTVLLSSHQINEVERVADWIGVIRDGRLVVCDELATLKGRFERWVVTVKSEQAEIDLPGVNMVTYEGQQRKRRQLTMLDAAPGASDAIRNQPEVIDVEVHSASLEDIFVALMKSKLIVPPPHPSMQRESPSGSVLLEEVTQPLATTESDEHGLEGVDHE